MGKIYSQLNGKNKSHVPKHQPVIDTDEKYPPCLQNLSLSLSLPLSLSLSDVPTKMSNLIKYPIGSMYGILMVNVTIYSSTMDPSHHKTTGWDSTCLPSGRAMGPKPMRSQVPPTPTTSTWGPCADEGTT